MTSALLTGFVIAVALRSAIGGAAVADSAAAGLVFAAALFALSAATAVARRADHTPAFRRAWLGVPAAGVLLLAPMVSRLAGGEFHRPAGSFVTWAMVVGVVAFAEEAFLRGALFDVLSTRCNVPVAVGTGAVLFAALHVPLYGWHVVPLDLVVGVWLGGVRVVGRTWLAPAVAHTVADWAMWWLR